MRTKCYSVRLQSLTKITHKAYKAKAFDGSEAIIPVSCVFGNDFEVLKSDAYWIASWVLEKKSIQCSSKKVAWFDSETGKMLPTQVIKHHTPGAVNAVACNEINKLKK